MISTNERIERLKATGDQLDEQIKAADFEIAELQNYRSKLSSKRNRVWGRQMKLMGASIQRNLRGSKEDRIVGGLR